MSSPKISIIVPVYNVEKYIRRCLDSIAGQTFTDWECICVDDGTPDTSGKICDEYMTKDVRFRVIHQENAGVSVARNIGLDAAKGDWIVFVDGDDWVSITMLQDLYDKALENDVDVVLGGYYLTDGNQEYDTILPKEGLLSMPKDFATKWQGPCAKLIKKSVLHKNNIRFLEGITLAEDLFFTFRVYYSSNKILGLPRPCYYYYQNENSVCHAITEKNVLDEIAVIEKMEDFLKKSDSNEWKNFLVNRKISAKNKYIFSIEKSNFIAWKEYYKDVTSSIVLKNSQKSYIPVLIFVCLGNSVSDLLGFPKNRKNLYRITLNQSMTKVACLCSRICNLFL